MVHQVGAPAEERDAPSSRAGRHCRWRVDTQRLWPWLGRTGSAQLNPANRDRSSRRSSPGTQSRVAARGHRGCSPACRRWCSRSPARPTQLPGGAGTSELGFLHPVLAAWCALQLWPPGMLASPGLAEVQQVAPAAHGSALRLSPAVPSAALAHVVVRAEPRPGSEASSCCSSLSQA